MDWRAIVLFLVKALSGNRAPTGEVGDWAGGVVAIAVPLDAPLDAPLDTPLGALWGAPLLVPVFCFSLQTFSTPVLNALPELPNAFLFKDKTIVRTPCGKQERVPNKTLNI